MSISLQIVDTTSIQSITGKTFPSIIVTGGSITGMANPVNPSDVANKSYVDAATSGTNVHPPVKVATTGALTVTVTPGSADLNGGVGIGYLLTNAGAQAALAIDGVTLSLTDRVLVKDQADQKQNGIYTATNLGSGSTNWVLTRSTDDNDSVLNQMALGDYIYVQTGTSNVGTAWVQTGTGPGGSPYLVIGTSNVIYTQFGSTGANTALSNLITTSITVDLLPDVPNSHRLGDSSHQWLELNTDGLILWNQGSGTYLNIVIPATSNYALQFPTSGGSAGQVLTSNGASPTAVLSWTTPTGTGANTSLSNLTSTAINVSLDPGVNNAYSLGVSHYWNNILGNLFQVHNPGDGGTTSITRGAGAGATNLILPAGNGVSGDTLVTDGTGILSWSATGAGLNVALSNASATALNVDLNPGVDNTIELGNPTHRYTDLDIVTVTLYGATSGNIIVAAPAIPTPYTLTLPPTAGYANQIPLTNGAGSLDFVDPYSTMFERYMCGACDFHSLSDVSIGSVSINGIQYIITGSPTLAMLNSGIGVIQIQTGATSGDNIIFYCGGSGTGVGWNYTTGVGIISLPSYFRLRSSVNSLSGLVIFVAGFIDPNETDLSNLRAAGAGWGAFFRMDTAVDTNIYCVCKTGTGTETAVSSGITGNSGLQRSFHIIATSSSVLFYIDDVLKATIATHIPVTSGNSNLTAPCWGLQTLQNVSQEIVTDYVKWNQPYGR